LVPQRLWRSSFFQTKRERDLSVRFALLNPSFAIDAARSASNRSPIRVEAYNAIIAMLALRYDLLLGASGRKMVLAPRPGFIPQDGRIVGEAKLPRQSMYLNVDDPFRRKAEAGYYIVDVAVSLRSSASFSDAELPAIPDSVYESSRTAAIYGRFAECAIESKDRMVTVDPSYAADALFVLTSSVSQIESSRDRISARAAARASLADSANYNVVVAVIALVAMSLTYVVAGKKDEKKIEAPKPPSPPSP
jgi:hypothetical protein